MRRFLVLVLAPVGFVYGAALPLRVWWRVRRLGTPRAELAEAMAAELRAMAKEAYNKMSPEMRAKVDADNRYDPN